MSGYIRASVSASFVAIAAVAAAQAPAAPPPIATIRVVYIEVSPSEINRAVNALKSYRQATQKAPGAGHVEVMQQIGRPNFFAVHETWNDGGSLQAQHLSEDNLKRVRALNDIAQARGQSLAQMALAWVLRDPRVTSTLIGASNAAQIRENVAALKNLSFSADELRAIDAQAQEGNINLWAGSSKH